MNEGQVNKHPDSVAGMFDMVSPRYDILNTILSAGLAGKWRQFTTKAVKPKSGQRILDVAAGTGTSSVSLAQYGAYVTAVDFSAGMLEQAKKRWGNHAHIEFMCADAMNLPFEDACFDAVTISFGLRNVCDPKVALAEFARVVKPGGRIVVCEFSTPEHWLIGSVYRVYLQQIMPRMSKLFTGASDAYRYLASSIDQWPSPQQLSLWMTQVGLQQVRYSRRTFGIVAVHKGIRPAHVQNDTEQVYYPEKAVFQI